MIFGIETVPVEYLLAEFGAEISESYRMAGSPGPWAANLGSAPEYLHDHGIKGFTLSSSYGLSGWVLAKEVFILKAEHGAPPAEFLNPSCHSNVSQTFCCQPGGSRNGQILISEIF